MKSNYLAKSSFVIFLLIMVLLAISALAQKPCVARNKLLLVTDASGKSGYIDRNGKIMLGPRDLPEAGVLFEDFHEGLAAIAVNKNVIYGERTVASGHVHYGYIDRTGKLVIKPQFDFAYGFCKGLALVHKGEATGYIDRTGKLVLNLNTDCDGKPLPRALAALCPMNRKINGIIGKPSEGLVAVATGAWAQGSKFGFWDLDGKMVIQPQFEPEAEGHGFTRLTSRFVSGLAAVKLNGKYGFIDKRGQLVIKPVYKTVTEFHEGLAYVEFSDTEFGYIDRRGRIVLKSDQWRYGEPFSGGLAATYFKSPDGNPWYSDHRIGYIDKKGKIAIEPRFDQAYPFADGVARIYESHDPKATWLTRFGWIDRKGRYVWKPGSTFTNK